MLETTNHQSARATIQNQKSTIPRAPGLPWLGTLSLLRNPQSYIAEMYAKLGPIFRFRQLGREWVVLAGREASAFFANSPPEAWGRRSLFHSVTKDLGTGSFIPALEGKEKEFYRRIMQLALSTHVVSPHVPRILKMMNETVDQWPLGQPINAIEYLGRIASEQMGYATANRSLKSVFHDVENLMLPMFAVPLGILPSITLKLPGYQGRKKRVSKFLAQVIEEHRGRTPGVDSPSDLVDILFQQRTEQGEPLDTASILATTLFAWASGQIYLSRHYAFLLYSLLANPTVMERVVEEVDAVNAHGEPTVEMLKRMRWLRAANLETLRMFPIQSVMPFTLEQDLEFRGHPIRKGEMVMFVPMIAQREAEIYLNPDAFDLERFYEPRSEHRSKHAFTSYGVYPRNCTAMGMVEMMTLCTFSVLLHKRRFEQYPLDYKLLLHLNPVPSPKKYRVRVFERVPTHPVVEQILGSGGAPSNFLKSLEEDQLQGLVKRTRVETVKPGAVIIRQGDVADTFYVILSGDVDVFQTQPDGQQKFLRTMRKDAYFGEIGLLESCPRTATVQARADSSVELLVIDRETFFEFVVQGDMIGSEIAITARQRVMSGHLANSIPKFTEGQITSVVGEHEIRRFGPGEVIVKEGDYSDAFYIITQGMTEVFNESPGGEEIFLRNLKAGEYFGEIGLIRDVPRTATVRVCADSVVQVIVINRKNFLKIGHDSGDALTMVGRNMCERLLATASREP